LGAQGARNFNAGDGSVGGREDEEVGDGDFTCDEGLAQLERSNIYFNSVGEVLDATAHFEATQEGYELAPHLDALGRAYQPNRERNHHLVFGSDPPEVQV